jgi:heme oxygenase
MSEIQLAIENTQKDTFLSDIRAATAPMHRRLESSAISTSLMSEAVTPDAYYYYLCCMSEVISFYEKVIFPIIADIIPDIDSRRKSTNIHADLHTFNNTITPMALPVFYPLDRQFSIPFALGYMYVIEGSTLGGRIILKHISNKLGISEKNSGKFFTGYGPDTGIYWKRFLSILSEYAIAHGQQQEIIDGACHAFESIDKYFVSNAF